MDNEKLKKIKIQLSKLNINELKELDNYFYERKKIVRKLDYQKRIQDKIDEITVLPVGTKVVIDNNNWPDLTGRKGVIVRHLGRKSTNTNIRLFDDKAVWSLERRYLSADLSEENLKRIEKQRIDTIRLSGFLNKIKI